MKYLTAFLSVVGDTLVIPLVIVAAIGLGFAIAATFPWSAIIIVTVYLIVATVMRARER
jgi:hypothetical protein